MFNSVKGMWTIALAIVAVVVMAVIVAAWSPILGHPEPGDGGLAHYALYSGQPHRVAA